MKCITSIAILKDGKISASATVKGKISTAAIVKGKIKAVTNLLLSGINSTACPLIICIDGGSASTALFPSVNGLLNGGTA
jgi:hypothetical protein